MNKLKKFLQKHPLVYSILIATAVVIFWRGLWNLIDMYFFPHYPVWSNLISMLIGLFILYLNDFDLKDLS